ncbi:hypothetical protein IMG5_115510 [Ichthyophthirius multifiliis]|uniref:Uncharacterized protein n=1 Tax=Ichthyophthirius multifiliis TaxID=5932 RepID=G0QU81_ICHMU|nr:hypothetical protein IMG5_115510 [Ichthyophthirius multifiliis]EGR31218.1 hypothetical protein IMG5_115510 [Ichthyophthirius multifiliis]|eukprot:XP_004034704.1 hypothetical protein IMG5_115510 [Ichthyophthirius multifiliis]
MPDKTSEDEKILYKVKKKKKYIKIKNKKDIHLFLVKYQVYKQELQKIYILKSNKNLTNLPKSKKNQKMKTKMKMKMKMKMKTKMKTKKKHKKIKKLKKIFKKLNQNISQLNKYSNLLKIKKIQMTLYQDILEKFQIMYLHQGEISLNIFLQIIKQKSQIISQNMFKLEVLQINYRNYFQMSAMKIIIIIQMNFPIKDNICQIYQQLIQKQAIIYKKQAFLLYLLKS